MSQNLHELTEIHTIIVAFGKERMDNTIDQRINGEFWNSEEILTGQGSTIASVEGGETGIETFDLAGSDFGRDNWEMN